MMTTNRRTVTIPTLLAALLAALMLAACSDQSGGETASAPEPEASPVAEATPEADDPMAPEAPPIDSELVATNWELLQIQSMDDSSWAPEDPSRYTLSFGEDGMASMQLDCNRGAGKWESAGPGQLTFGPIAGTRALCQDDGLSERYAAQFQWVRTYVLRDGHLYLATMADGAILEFQPAE